MQTTSAAPDHPDDGINAEQDSLHSEILPLQITGMAIAWSMFKQRNLKLILVLTMLVTYLSQHVPSPDRSEKVCNPKINVTFLKTHKTASTTIQNILMRYGIKHGALFVLPPEDNILSSRKLFHENNKWLTNISSYNMLAHHTRLHYQAMRQFMPPDTLFITVLRDPLAAFESMFSYYDMQNMYQVPIEEFKVTSKIQLLKHRHLGYLGTNQMLFDMGFDGSDRDGSKLPNFIQELDQVFDLVLITEHLSESLVLLKHLLCWTTEDVLSFKLNVRQSKHRIDTGVERLIRSVNWADQILYEHFVSKFNNLVHRFGRKEMTKEVKELEDRNEEIFKRCVASTSVGEHGIVEYVLREKSSQCWLMTRSEQQLTSVLRERQNQRYDSGRKSEKR